MMYRLTGVSCSILCFVLLLSTPVLAEETPTTPTEKRPAQIKQEQLEKKRTNTPQDMQERKTTTQERLETPKQNTQQRQEKPQEKQEQTKQTTQEQAKEKRAEAQQKRSERLAARFELYYERLSTLASKIELSFTTMARTGTDTSTAQAKLSEAKTALEEAKVAGQQAVAILSAIETDQSATSSGQLTQARSLTAQAHNGFKHTIELLKEAVRIARNNQGSEKQTSG